VAEASVRAARGGVPVVVQVGHNSSIEEARQLAAHAQRIGADAVSATPPWLFQTGLARQPDRLRCAHRRRRTKTALRR
jgi:N-acetylneuraminate lyase